MVPVNVLLSSLDKQSNKSCLPYLWFLLPFKGLLLIGCGAKPLTEGLLLQQIPQLSISLRADVDLCTADLPSSAAHQGQLRAQFTPLPKKKPGTCRFMLELLLFSLNSHYTDNTHLCLFLATLGGVTENCFLVVLQGGLQIP